MEPLPHSCPNCGAPLTVGEDPTAVLCLYCDTVVRLAPAQAQPGGERAADIAPETVHQIKQLLLQGRRSDAVRLYQQAAGVDEAEAAAAVLAFSRQLSLGVVQAQQLNPRGALLFLLFLLGLIAAVAAGVGGVIPAWIAMVLGVIALILLWPLARGTLTTIRYLGARRAEATVLRAAPIGEIGEAHVFRVLLEVQPPGGAPFQAEMNLPVRRRNVPNLRPGLVLRVKYLPGDRSSVIFAGIA
jgi:hypothetical protein